MYQQGVVPFDYFGRTMQAGDAGMNAILGQGEMIGLGLNEAFRRDALAQNLAINDRNFQASRPGVLDNVGAGLGVLYTGAQAWNALRGNQAGASTASSLWGTVSDWVSSAWSSWG